MSLDQFNEVNEVAAKRFSESPLGKLAENKVFDKPMSDYDKPLAVICDNIKNCPIDDDNIKEKDLPAHKNSAIAFGSDSDASFWKSVMENAKSESEFKRGEEHYQKEIAENMAKKIKDKEEAKR